MTRIDDLLKTGRRGLRTRPGSLLLGPTGARLWVDYLEDRPGFAGAIDFIHKLNIPLLFTIERELGPVPQPSDVVWRPSHLTTQSRHGALTLEERRYITWDDVAVSVQRWHNPSGDGATLKLVTDPEWVAREAGGARGERAIDAHGFVLRAVVAASDPRAWDGLVIAPGETRELVVAAVLGTRETDDWERLAAQATAITAQPADTLMQTQVDAYQAWFDQTPRFSSSSPMLDRLYAYRWYLMRNTLARPGLSPLGGTFFYEGRSHKMTKTPWAPVGWEFSKLIPLSTPMHLIESRWHQEAGLGTDVFATLAQVQGEDGQFHARTLGKELNPYANFMGWAAYQYGLAQGVNDRLHDGLELLKRQVRGEDRFLASSGDGLPIQQRHQLTGKEYQPSYWFFHEYPNDPFDPATYTPLKRVDRAIYQYLNARGVAGLCRLTGDGEAHEFDALAERVAHSVLDKQWDSDTGFFYDLHHETDQKAMVRNVVGFYPYWAGLTSGEHLPGMLAALGPEHFDTPVPLPSTSPECPVFQSGGSWKGQFFKGRNGCMWDGPTWPYTNSVAIDAIGNVSRANGHAQDGLFAHFFWKYALLHFQQQDGVTPYLVEHYDSMTGEPISDEPDYSHSYLIDLIVRQVAGVQLDEAGYVSLDPVDIGLEHFALKGLPVRGKLLDIEYSRAGGAVVVARR